MKSFFTKLSVLLCCGVMALSGCTDFSADLQDVNRKVDELAAKTEQQIKDLAASIAETYVTKTELEAVVDELNDLKDAVAELQTLIDTKADKTAVAEAIADLEEKIAAIKECECEPQEPCDCEPVDLTAIYDALAALEEQLEAIKGCECEPQEPCTCEPVDLTVINDAITALQDQIAETEAVLDEIKAELAKIDPILAEVNTKILEAMALAEAAATMEEVEAAFAELEAELAGELAAIRSEIAGFAEDYEALNDKIAELEAALQLLNDKINALAAELRGIVMVPQILVDGTPAVEFKTFAYVPMAEDNDDVPAVEGTGVQRLGSNQTYAYYHFNPSNFNIASATYSIVSANVETRANDAVATVGEVVKEGDKVKVALTRGGGSDNMFALAVTLQSGAVITSEYAYVLDAQSTAEDLVISGQTSPLYATLAEAEAGNDLIDARSIDALNFADYVTPIDPFFASFGLEYKYSLVYGNIAVAEDGTADLRAGNGVSIVKVEAVNGSDVVRRAYIRINVNYVEAAVPGVYYYAAYTASVQAERIAFEVKDILAWVKALKDEPNTKEILVEVVNICKRIAEIQASEESQIQKLYLIKEEAEKAYELLNGVPGFVKKYQTFSGNGEGIARVNLIPEIMSITELKAVLKMIEENYPEMNIMDDLAIAITNFIPEALRDNWLVASILNSLKDFKLSDILENDLVENLLLAGEQLANSLGLNILDFDKINAALEEIIKRFTGETNYGETAAKIAAQAKARAAAEEVMKANYEAANEQLMANLQNGPWGQILDLLNTDLNLDNEIVAGILEKLQLTETVNMLVEFLSQVRDQSINLVQYTYDSGNIVYVEDELTRYEVK